MSIARFLTAGVMAIVVTLGLLLLMHILIQNNLQGPMEGKKYTVPEIVMPDREIKTEYDTSKPDKPDEPEETPPEIPEPEFDTSDADTGGIAIKPSVDSNLDVGGISFIAGDGEMIPLTLVQPEYPRRALQRGIEGYCEVRFTVTSLGTTSNFEIGDCPETIFERSSIKAAEKLKFKPRVVNGKAVDAPGQGYKFTYQLAKE